MGPTGPNTSTGISPSLFPSPLSWNLVAFSSFGSYLDSPPARAVYLQMNWLSTSRCSPGPSIDERVRSRLQSLNDEFLSVLEGDVDQLLAFTNSWSSFLDSMESMEHLLQPDVRTEITLLAELVSSVASTAIEADDACSRTLEQWTAEVKVTLTEKTEIGQSSSALPRYFEPSLRWLQRNIHNPYPSQGVRKAIARETNSSVKDIDAWFIDIRKRIGWSGLRYSRFGNRKADIVDAATRFFTDSDPLRPLESIIESEFASIASTVDQLYQEKCAGSALASRLDEAVKDLTPDLQASLSKKRRQERIAACQPRGRRSGLHLYPTPELSPTLSSTTLATPEPSSFELQTSKKRSRSTSEESPSDLEERTRIVKRTRHTATPSLSQAPSCYPSPAASIVMGHLELPVDQPASADVTPKSTGKRKRTLSDAGITRPSPSREPASQPDTSSYPSPLSVNEVLDHAVFSPATCSPGGSSTAHQGAYNPYNAFAALFAAFTGTGADAISATSSQTQLPILNLVDEVPPANVHVEYDQSWSLDYCADELAPSLDTSLTDYNINFEDFGSNLYSNSTDLLGGPTQHWGSFWLATPSQESHASGSSSGSYTTSLPLAAQPNPHARSSIIDSSAPASQLYLSTPSPTYGRQPYPLSDLQPPGSSNPLARLTDKAKELMELEARCAALRNELVSVC